jgi:hypothetical protein
MPSAKATIAAPVAACAQRAPWKSPETSSCRSDRSARCSSDGAIDLLSLVEWARKLSRSRSRLSRMKAVSYPSATKRMPWARNGSFDLFLLETDGSLLTGDLGEPGDLVDQLARGPPAHRKRELHPQRQAVEDVRQREANEGRGRGATEDDGTSADRRPSRSSCRERANRKPARASCDIHGTLHKRHVCPETAPCGDPTLQPLTASKG